MKPDLANDFAVGFIEGGAGFGNPIVVGGKHAVFSTGVFLAIVGAQYDSRRAASLALMLTGRGLCTSLAADVALCRAFAIQLLPGPSFRSAGTQEIVMKPIAKALVPMLFVLLSSDVWAIAGCGRWGCGQNSPVVAGVRANTGDAAGLVLHSIRTPPSPPRELRAPVAPPLPFVPGWGVNLNSPVISGAATADAALHGAPSSAAPSRRVSRR